MQLRQVSYQNYVPRSSLKHAVSWKSHASQPAAKPKTESKPATSTGSQSLRQQTPLPRAPVCPLEDERLPPVGEAEHQAGYCYCHHCRCGTHRCARQRNRQLSVPCKSTYAQTYKSVPILRKADAELVPTNRGHFRPLKCSLEDLTTNLHNYVRWPMAPPPRVIPNSTTVPLKHIGSTLYARDFVNWQTGPTVIEKEPQFPYRGDMVHFTEQSNYRASFLGHSLRNSSDAKRPASNKLGKGPHVADQQSMTRAQFQNWSCEAAQLNKRSQFRRSECELFVSVPRYEESTYRRTYKRNPSNPCLSLSRKS